MTFGTGFGKLGASFGRLGASGGSGDPTLLTAANVDAFLTSLGLTQAGTGTTYGETGQDATPLYAVAANKVPLATETVIGRDWFGPIVNPSATNLVTYSRDLTNAAWTKTGCTAALALGGLVRDADWRGPNVITDSGFDNPSGWAGSAIAGNAEVTGGKLVFNNVASTEYVYPTPNTIASETVEGKFYLATVKISNYVSGALRVNVRNGGLESFPEANGTHTNIVVAGGSSTDILSGLRTLGTCTFDVDDFTIEEVDVHTLLTATANNATATLPITSTSGERTTQLWLRRRTGTGTIRVKQDASTWAAVTLTSVWQRFVIAPATLANPEIGIEIQTSGDAIEVGGVSHQVAARNLRPFTEQTAGATATVGARTLSRTIGATTAAVDFELVALAVSDDSAHYAGYYRDGTESFGIRNASNQRASAFWRVGSISYQYITTNDGLPRGVTYKLRFLATPGGTVALYINDSLIGSAAIPADTLQGGTFEVGGNGNSAPSEAPILAFRDNIGNLLDGQRGWNHSLIDNWSA